MYLVMETPEKLKKAIERHVKERIPYSLGSLFICVKASEMIDNNNDDLTDNVRTDQLDLPTYDQDCSRFQTHQL